VPRRVHQPQPSHHCPRCRHDLAGLPGVGADASPAALITCPECGTPTTIMAARDARPEDRGWSYFVLWVTSVVMGMLLLACVIGVLLSVLWGVATTGGP
jgi:hypothetical protein